MNRERGGGGKRVAFAEELPNAVNRWNGGRVSAGGGGACPVSHFLFCFVLAVRGPSRPSCGTSANVPSSRLTIIIQRPCASLYVPVSSPWAVCLKNSGAESFAICGELISNCPRFGIGQSFYVLHFIFFCRSGAESFAICC